MATRSALAAKSFNQIYPSVRSMMNQMGCSGHVKTFYDGTAVIDLIVTGNNVTASLSIVISTKLDDKGNVIGYRFADSERMRECKSVSEALQLTRTLVYRTKNILAKV